MGNYTETIKNIFKVNLNVKKDEKLLIFTDNFNRELTKIAKRFLEISKIYTSKNQYMEFPPTGSHGVEPPEELWVKAFGEATLKVLKQKRLLRPILNKTITKRQLKRVENIIKNFKRDAVDVVIALSYYSTTHTIFRDLLTRICGTRYASMPLFEEVMLKGAMGVDWEKMQERIRSISRRIKKSESIEINTPNGSFLTFSTKDREVREDTGILRSKGRCGNLPAGEVFLAPVEGTAEGKLVLEWAPTRRLKRPITLHVKRGRAERVEGEEEYADFLRKKFRENPKNANIAEFGIGTNDRASRPDNILESEKIFGTIHIALGDNSSFGGKIRTPFHQDFVFFKPTVLLFYKTGRRGLLFINGKLKK